MPGVCQAGASTDFNKYNAPLTLAEATAAIGTPATNRWTLVDEQPTAYQVKCGTLPTGIYRLDAYNSVESYSSQIAVLDKPTDYTLWLNDSPTPGLNVRIYMGTNSCGAFNGCNGENCKFMILASTNSRYTPGITLDDMKHAARNVAIYRLQ
ncbi:MAG: hypothetical protein LBL52_01590 [Rickettsiales bacterium]|nr:hypothetical protein [Rickettsiales bacterium]